MVDYLLSVSTRRPWKENKETIPSGDREKEKKTKGEGAWRPKLLRGQSSLEHQKKTGKWEGSKGRKSGSTRRYAPLR